MPGKAAKVKLAEKQQVIPREFSMSRTDLAVLRQRDRNTLRAFDGAWNSRIAAESGLERHQVGIWRRRQNARVSLTR
jgi:hypothetical protein